MPAEFEKYWSDLRKHHKRRRHWLPAAVALARELAGRSGLKYFTLCARSMVDVFMFVREGLLDYSAGDQMVRNVSFCEMDEELFPEIKELIGLEDAGFPGRLEDLALFEDDGLTGQYGTIDEVSGALEDEGLPRQSVDMLITKRRYLQLRGSFPYDVINLDFCGYYYEPPDILRINQTVGRFLEWQREAAAYGKIEEFVIFVTCRHDDRFPPAATEHLKDIARANYSGHEPYRSYFERTRRLGDIERWANGDNEDFFLSVWPKEIARLAQRCGWGMEILGYPYYDRVSDGGYPYKIACLVVRFRNVQSESNYLQVALHALNRDSRELIREISAESVEGRQLTTDLAAIVELRNRHATARNRPILQMPQAGG